MGTLKECQDFTGNDMIPVVFLLTQTSESHLQMYVGNVTAPVSLKQTVNYSMKIVVNFPYAQAYSSDA
jgi:hypothetical protein